MNMYITDELYNIELHNLYSSPISARENVIAGHLECMWNIKVAHTEFILSIREMGWSSLCWHQKAVVCDYGTCRLREEEHDVELVSYSYHPTYMSSPS
jgi:hypothetical protein